MAKDVTTVKILDSNYKIACPADEAEAVKQAAVFLDERLREIKEGSDLDEKKIAIITALNITNEYLKSLSNPQASSSNSPLLDDLTEEVKSHLKSLSL
jgi:cell division protein ZapA|tara:strand:+ start:252 stop:545 length:294 start_codon:yes stop_codon:yes gene_type:complete